MGNVAGVKLEWRIWIMREDLTDDDFPLVPYTEQEIEAMQAKVAAYRAKHPVAEPVVAKGTNIVISARSTTLRARNGKGRRSVGQKKVFVESKIAANAHDIHLAEEDSKRIGPDPWED
jgi:hypothetical protein